MVLQDIKEAKELLYLSQGSSEATALIIDGRSLSYALEDDVKQLFLELAMGCASVICCRSSPKQKALVSSIVLPLSVFSINHVFYLRQYLKCGAPFDRDLLVMTVLVCLLSHPPRPCLGRDSFR